MTFAGLTGLLFLVILFRYIFIASAFYLAFYIFDPKGFDRRRILNRPKGFKQYKKEFGWSVFTSTLFVVTGLIMIVLWQKGYSSIYEEIR